MGVTITKQTESDIITEEPLVQLTTQDIDRLSGYTWDMGAYSRKVPPSTITTYKEAEFFFQLDPEPPKVDDPNDYILAAQQKKELRYLSFFLHSYEKKLNGRIRSYLMRDGKEVQDPERFLDIKMACMEVILKKLPEYDPSRNVKFATYIYRFIGDVLLSFRMREEAWKISSLSEYRLLRRIAGIYRECAEKINAAAEKICAETGWSKETAHRYLGLAAGIRTKQELYSTWENAVGKEIQEEVCHGDLGNYWYWLFMEQVEEAVQKGFAKLKGRDKALLEKRNAVCMTCGWVGKESDQYSNEQLSAIIQGSTDNGVKKAYDEAVRQLASKMAEHGKLGTILIKQTRLITENKKITGAEYAYKADCDGGWGDIHVDFMEGKGRVLYIAELDTLRSQIYAQRVISYILNCKPEELPNKQYIPLDW